MPKTLINYVVTDLISKKKEDCEFRFSTPFSNLTIDEGVVKKKENNEKESRWNHIKSNIRN